jgi:NADPH-dependent 2,4-dienoyl-CoA reductase/sulfur reductase-like enzyme/nitrite reductase/ring-hydroxylating ferredoxin subunit
MSEREQPAGPDLAGGFKLSDVPDGGILAGRVGEEAVVVVRSGRDLHALDAACTHYGGPLAEGIVEGGSIRCPWHHARFDLATGAACGGPALTGVSAWEVERQGERFRITRRRAPAPSAGTPAERPDSAVIVGAGAAGSAAAVALRDAGYDGPVTLLTGERELPYDRPNLSKDYLAGNAPEEWIPLKDEAYWRGRGIDLRMGVRVSAIDPDRRSLRLEDGSLIAYGALLLATGAEPVKLPVPGADLPHVHTLRTLADSRAIAAACGKARRAVVLGASFVGLEVAASLRARGLSVDVAAPEEHPLARILGPEVGSFVRSLHEEHGVRFHLGRTAGSIDAERVVLSDGASLPADLVVIGAGVRPAVELARQAGLAAEEGVLVDERFRATAPGIYAAGDVARYPDARSGELVRIEHWVAAQRQGRAAARSMLGLGEPFRAPPFFWSVHYDVRLSYVGHASGRDRAEVHGSLTDRDAAVVYRRGGRAAALLTVGRDRLSLEGEARMERGDEAGLEAAIRRASGWPATGSARG